MKGVTKVSFENVQPVKEVYLREENSETKTEHVRTDMKARQTDKSKFSQRGFPTQKSPSSRSKLPSSWPTVPDFELRWKHPITLLNDLAGPRLDFIEVPFSVQLILTIRIISGGRTRQASQLSVHSGRLCGRFHLLW